MVIEASDRRGFLARPSGKILVAIGVFLVVLALVADGRSDSTELVALRAEVRKVSDAVAELSLAVEALVSDPRGGEVAKLDAPSSPAARTTAVESPETLAAIARLEQLVRDLAQRPPNTSGARSPSVPGRASIRDIRVAFERVRDSEYAALDDVLTSEHLLWSVEDVVARYGLPARVEPQQSSPSLIYELDDDGSAQNPPSVSFDTQAGRVTRVAVFPGG